MYHWARRQEAPIDTSFSHAEIAGERALVRTSATSCMIFGMGPPLGGDLPDVRTHRLLRVLSPDVTALRWGRQVHGSGVAAVGQGDDSGPAGSSCVGSCDALVTARTGVGLMVWTADCVPILLESSGAVAAVHSGWRGTAADIIGAVIRNLETDHGVTAEEISAALGPAISGPCYEVGHEVIAALQERGPELQGWRHGRRVDLRRYLVGRLCQLGVRREAITVVGPCTATDPRLASYRRDGDRAGRQFALVYRRREGASDLRPRN